MRIATPLSHVRVFRSGATPPLLLVLGVIAFALLSVALARPSVTGGHALASPVVLHVLFEVTNFGIALAYLVIGVLIFRGLVGQGLPLRANMLGVATGLIFLTCSAGHFAHVGLTHLGGGRFDTAMLTTQIVVDFLTLGVAMTFFALRTRYSLITGGEAALLDMRDRLAEREAALHEVRAALAVRDQFLTVAAHELRTPLTALKGHIQLAKRRFSRGMPERAQDHIIRAEEQIERLTMLVNNLLDVSRLNAGRLDLVQRPVDLAPVIRRVVELERDVPPEREIDLTCPESLPPVLADPTRIEQVLINLLENARKYSPEGRPIRVTAEVRDGAIVIAVQDHGIGIPAEEQTRIFERFHRAANVDRNVAGLGLGLYIAWEIVRAHNGTVTVTSHPGQGSTFQVTIPGTAGVPPASAPNGAVVQTYA
jgi:signal transduction histidine kinase